MYVEVAVDFTDQDRLRTYTYAIPGDANVQPGDLLWVPFGNRPIQGIALSLTATFEAENVRVIDRVVEGGPYILRPQLGVARWIADHYRTNIFRACALMLPPGANRQLHIWISRTETAARVDDILSGVVITEDQRDVLEQIPIAGRIRRDRLVRRIGSANERHLDALVRSGIVWQESVWDQPQVRAIHKPFVDLALEGSDLESAIEGYEKRRAHRRVALLRHLASAALPVPRSDLSREFGSSTVKAVIDDGVAKVDRVRVERDPLSGIEIQDSLKHDLIPEQRVAVRSIVKSIEDSRAAKFLLFGVTGGGKTEVYLRAVEYCVNGGKRAIVMVPEIAMTPQMMHRFVSRFPGDIAMLHSGLTLGQRFDQWDKIRSGRYRVIIGSRSAIFAPVTDLGLVVIDEEHEWTYKQSDRAPRYHARDVAERLCDATGATLVLGSATPDLATYHRASNDEGIALLSLPRRINVAVAAFGSNANVSDGHAVSSIVDMRDEIRDGHREALSRPLLDALSENVARGEKSILFINRRGTASFVQCLGCGSIRACPNCFTPLALHRTQRREGGSRLQCHYCSYSVRAARQCRDCGGTGIARRAAGTEGIEEAVRGFFPTTPILRWDSDTAKNANEHAKLLKEFEADGNHILIGTQMVAKGLDIPSVSLVGVVAADIGLAVPSFRSSERTYQLLSQVTGRAGRADTPGVAIIQTFQPQHFAIRSAADQDFRAFYEHEITSRSDYNLPPFANYIRIETGAFQREEAELEARSVRTRIDDFLDGHAESDFEVAGPSPSYPARRAGRYRWQLLIKGEKPSELLDAVPLAAGWTVDVDPLEMS